MARAGAPLDRLCVLERLAPFMRAARSISVQENDYVIIIPPSEQAIVVLLSIGANVIVGGGDTASINRVRHLGPSSKGRDQRIFPVLMTGRINEDTRRLRE